jgi:histone H3/H4
MARGKSEGVAKERAKLGLPNRNLKVAIAAGGANVKPKKVVQTSSSSTGVKPVAVKKPKPKPSVNIDSPNHAIEAAVVAKMAAKPKSRSTAGDGVVKGVPVTVVVKAVRKYKAGTRARIRMRQLQKFVGSIIARKSFRRLVEDVGNEILMRDAQKGPHRVFKHVTGLRMTADGFEAFLFCIQGKVLNDLNQATRLMFHRKRVTLTGEDIRVYDQIMSGEHTDLGTFAHDKKCLENQKKRLDRDERRIAAGGSLVPGKKKSSQQPAADEKKAAEPEPAHEPQPMVDAVATDAVPVLEQPSAESVSSYSSSSSDADAAVAEADAMVQG